MALIKAIVILFILPFVDVTVYIYNTVDSSSVEQYDCILHENLFYCRRPTEPIALNRSNDTMQCHHGGIRRSFADLYQKNVSISTVLHDWKSSLEKVEEYIRYIEGPKELDGYVCNCVEPQSFGKNCEYLLPTGTTFAQTLLLEYSLKRMKPEYVQLYGSTTCYMTLDCDPGLLCLDWRDICDGVQQCMLGLDEESCDKLEFNECENDEYRCMNGMCIPEEYFLDGDFDCLDWSDEIQYYDDINCALEAASAQCDDRICPPNQFSCGDGQCILDRFDFQVMSQVNSECRSRREQYFICETHKTVDMWTLPGGRCYVGYEYEDSMNSHTVNKDCYYLLLCDLSGAVHKHCPCGNTTCKEELNATCTTNHIQYPKGGIMAPYVLFFYRTKYQLTPAYIAINGTIKCDGILINISGIQRPFISSLRQLENILCQEAKDRSLFDNHDGNQECRQDLLTFNNRSYSINDVCNTSEKCISTYRIKDGFDNCVTKMDEITNISISTICSKMQRYRFRCSAEEPTCLSVTALGNLKNNCTNKYDELWLGTSIRIVDINCNKVSKEQCGNLRQYIEKSWVLNNANDTAQQHRIPFRYYCNTLWNLPFREDENTSECQKSWACSDDQWRCDTGQCIEGPWVLDGEWDCFDASDENYVSNSLITDRNLQVVSLSTLTNRSIEQSKSIPFSTICNPTTEFPCFPINVSNSLDNLTYSRPCINRQLIGDGHIDCYGGIDERNTITHCNQQTMLGYTYRCMSTDDCIPYWNHCTGDRCSTSTDDEFWCNRWENLSIFYDYKDSVCFNGQFVDNGRCDRIEDCPFGEDEYMCEYQSISKLTGSLYRKDKEVAVKNTEQRLQLLHFPSDSNITAPKTDSTSPTSTVPTLTSSLNNTSPIAYACNRGVGVDMHDGSIACFCPPQYYGDKCQFHTDRITLLIHLNLSQSIYRINSDVKTVLKILVLFLFNNETITNHIFHSRPTSEILLYSKKMVHLLYSRSFRLLQHKQQRYLNQSNIIHDHPYSIRIEFYEKKISEEPTLAGIWQYPIYFDYLPVFRLAKVLRLTKPNIGQDPCSSSPCNQNQNCRQLQNNKANYICLCKDNFTGGNCSIEDQQCVDGYCSVGSICKPGYRGLLIGNALPYCICRFDSYGDQCKIKYERCESAPCQNNGSCYSSSRPDSVSCLCTEQYHGKFCELRKPEVKLHINENVTYVSAVVQYFEIDFISFNLILSHQQVYRTLPTLLEYRHERRTVPEIILVKIYSSREYNPAELYLISVHINVSTISATTQVIEDNQCKHIRILALDNRTQITANYSPIQYHRICQNNTDLLCFRDDYYLCICEENHSRVECFHYDSELDQCSHCLAGGRCLQGDRTRPDDFICLCPACYSGTKCQFNSNSFVFTLDQLFFDDLNSSKQRMTFRLLIIIPLLLALIALPNNIFSFLTFRRQKCLDNGVGQYLFIISIVNQINLTLLAARLIHLSVSISGLHYSHPIVDNIFCKVLNYLLIGFTRAAYWLISFVATERVYTVVFLKGQWLKKPYIARRLIALIFFIVFASGAYELVFVKSFFFDTNDNKHMCFIEFPMTSRLKWMLIHQIISIAHSMLPLLINLWCTITMIYIITKSKMNIRRRDQGAEETDVTSNVKTDMVEEQENDKRNVRNKETRHRLYVLRDVLNNNKEVISRPTITLIPSAFSLFSLPLLIISFSLDCRNIEHNRLRYALIVFYFISFIPQIITFLLYVYPSSLYFNEWRSTTMGKWIATLRQQNIIILSTIKEETLKTLWEPKQD